MLDTHKAHWDLGSSPNKINGKRECNSVIVVVEHLRTHTHNRPSSNTAFVLFRPEQFYNKHINKKGKML